MVLRVVGCTMRGQAGGTGHEESSGTVTSRLRLARAELPTRRRGSAGSSLGTWGVIPGEIGMVAKFSVYRLECLDIEESYLRQTLGE